MISYRKDIDGLRAFAVTLVLLFHIQTPLIHGGFIGVDMFFVISGFLITSIINNKIYDDNFTYRDFYLRRLKRIYPLLLTVITTTIVAGYFILLPKAFNNMLNSVGMTFLSISNIYFRNISSGYFADDTNMQILLHTWSLGIEEQFYLLWPPILLGFYKISKKYPPYYAAFIVTILAIVSEVVARESKISSYYLIHARAYELLSGATLALFWEKLTILRKRTNHLISGVALLIILIMAFFLDKNSTFPGSNALIICLATCLIIYTGKDEAQCGFINTILSTKPIVFIGLISYSLYLWHWPIISFTNYLHIEKTFLTQCAVLMGTFCVSVASYYTVEQKFRYSKILTGKKSIIFLLLIPFVILSSFIAISSASQGLPHRFNEDIQAMIHNINSGYYSPCKTDACDLNYSDKLNGTLDSSDFLVIGDSHAHAAQGFINVLANDANKTGSVYYKNGTPLSFNNNAFEYYDGDNRAIFRQKITNDIKNIKQAVDEFNGKTVIISNRYGLYLYGRNEPSSQSNIIVSEKYNDSIDIKSKDIDYKSSLINSIHYITNAGKKVIILGPLPEFNSDLSRCDALQKVTNTEQRCYEEASSIHKRLLPIGNFLSDLPNKIEHVTYIDFHDYFCNENVCKPSNNGIAFYQDSNHLNYLGSKYLGYLFLVKNNNFLRAEENE